MIGPGTGVRVYLACGVTDMRKGIEGLAALAQDHLRQKPTSGANFTIATGGVLALFIAAPPNGTSVRVRCKTKCWALCSK